MPSVGPRNRPGLGITKACTKNGGRKDEHRETVKTFCQGATVLPSKVAADFVHIHWKISAFRARLATLKPLDETAAENCCEETS
ncbi:unnamed protein product [Scytosiphon promiscuus]